MPDTAPPSTATDLTPDQLAAGYLLSELRTRITTQPLPYQYGVEGTALKSLWEVFVQARAAMQKYPGCKAFAAEATRVLNEDLRPVTAKWDRGFTEGKLNSRDGADEFRNDLRDVRAKLVEFAKTLHVMAYGSASEDDFKGKPVLQPADLKQLSADLPFGIPEKEFFDPDEAKKLNNDELKVIVERRKFHLKPTGAPAAQTAPPNEKSGSESQKEAPAKPAVNAFGLGLSGGGIRSATFSLGVVQTLAAYGMLQEVDFLSTVSGGGYTGGFITMRLGDGPSEKKPAELAKDISQPHGPDPDAIRYLRQHAKYLAARNLKDSWGMVSATLAGMLLNWAVPLLLIVLGSLVAYGCEQEWGMDSVWPVLCCIAAVAFGFALLLYAYLIRSREQKAGPVWFILGVALAVFVAMLAGFGVTFLHGVLTEESFKNHPVPGGVAAMIAALTASAPAIIRFVPVLKNPSMRKVALAVLLWIAGIVMPLAALGLFLFSWAVAGHLFFAPAPVVSAAVVPPPIPVIHPMAPPRPFFEHIFQHSLQLIQALHTAGPHGFSDLLGRLFAGGIPGWIFLVGIAGILAVIDIALLDINLTSPFRLYRDGLNRTFVQRSDTLVDVPLSGINPEFRAPYHLINATLNIPSSQSVALRDRRADFFLFSKYWTGSPTVGYRPTKDWLGSGEKLSLATAVAISGAAVSTYMGLGTMPSLTALLVVLNVRLGFWIRKPDPENPTETNGKKRKELDLNKGSKHPGFTCLLKEMLGANMTEEKKWLNLSDGGHIENMGVYELLRRRCKFIICVDGESDPGYTFQGLMTLVRHAQIDFGAQIEPQLSNLRPDPQTGLTQSHSHLCRIHYQDRDGKLAGVGFLLYLKLSVTGNETELIKRFRTTHPDFPHQSTLEQFFDEEQFEAYRELGAHVAEGLFSTSLMDRKQPKNVQEWFTYLAENLLYPDPAHDHTHSAKTS